MYYCENLPWPPRVWGLTVQHLNHLIRSLKITYILISPKMFKCLAWVHSWRNNQKIYSVGSSIKQQAWMLQKYPCGLVTKSCPSLVTSWTVACLLCPWDFPDENTGVGCHALFQENLPIPGMETASPVVPALQAGYLPLSYLGCLPYQKHKARS